MSEGIADLYLDVGVEGGGMLDFSTGDRIADSGAASTRPVLTAWLGGDVAAAGTSDTGYVQTTPTRRVVIDPTQRRRTGGVLLLTRRDLQHRAARFGAVVIGVSVVFTLLFLMTGLTEQFHREPRNTVAAMGADAWLLREGASGAFTSGATMPADTAQLVDGVSASPVIAARHSITQGAEPIDIVVLGYEPGALGEPELTAGRLPDAPERDRHRRLVGARGRGVGPDRRPDLRGHRATPTARRSSPACRSCSWSSNRPRPSSTAGRSWRRRS